MCVGTPDAIQRLHASKIPVAFMTNGTGYTEAEKAKKISGLVGLPVNPANVVMATTHTNTCTYTHACTHKHIYTHACTHKHIHIHTYIKTEFDG